MSQTFAELVEEVKQLSTEEKKELHELLKKELIEERRREILANWDAGIKEMQNDELPVFSDTDSLLNSLSRD